MEFEKLIQRYYIEKNKKEWIKNIPENHVTTIASVIKITSLSKFAVDEHFRPKVTSQSKQYKKIYNQLLKDKKSGNLSSIINNIYQRNISVKLARFKEKYRRYNMVLLKEKYESFKYLRENQQEEKANKIIGKILSKADSFTQERYYALQQCIQILEKPVIKLDDSILRGKIDNDETELLKHVASIICYPEYMCPSLFYLHPRWKTFPLKWYANKFSIPYHRSLFIYYVKEKNLDIFILNEIKMDNLNKLVEQIGSSYITDINKYSKNLMECIKNYKNRSHIAAICTVFPLIEGMLRSGAYVFSRTHKNDIIVREGSKEFLITDNGKKIKDFTIGDILNKTAYGKKFDNLFIEHFCDELYNERNNILHGQSTYNFTKIYVAKKIIMVKYLFEQLSEIINNNMLNFMDAVEKSNFLEKYKNGNEISPKDFESIRKIMKEKD